ncbi:MAG: pyridoxal phosphate-dependent aminotransferase, partial [Brevinematales bacterium]
MRLSSRLCWNTKDNNWTKILAHHTIFYDLTISNPTKAFDLSQYEKTIIHALLQPEAIFYEPSPLGLESAREFLAKALPLPTHFSSENILLTSSTSEAYAFLFKLLCNPKDEILVPVPSYPLFEYLAKLEGIKIVPYRLDYIHGKGYEIDIGFLKRVLSPRTKALIYVHPNNPTGTGATEKEIATLNELMRQYDIALIVDEVFSDYWCNRPDKVPQSWLGLVDGPLFVLGGLSKSLLLPQMKLAWTLFSAPKKDMQKLEKAIELIGDTYLSPSLPIQLALPLWWKLKPELNSLVRERLSQNLDLLHSLFFQTPSRLQTYHGGWSAVIGI